MMHDHGKSDSAILAKKLANKTGHPVAERGERRVEAKGNADQQNTRRAQDRISVYHALEPIRQAARTRKKEQFTAASVPCKHRFAPTGILRTEAKSCAGRGWFDVERLRSIIGGQPCESA